MNEQRSGYSVGFISKEPTGELLVNPQYSIIFTNSRLLPKPELNVVSRASTSNERPQMMQQPCNTNEGKKAMFSHPATNERPYQRFYDVSTSQ